MVLQRHLCLIPRTCEHVKLHGKGEIWLQMKLRLLISWHWDGWVSWVILMDLITTEVLRSGREMQKKRSWGWCSVRKTQAAAAGSEDEERTMSQGMWAASRSWKQQGNGLPLESPESMQPYQHLGFSPVRWDHVDFWLTELWASKLLLF